MPLRGMVPLCAQNFSVVVGPNGSGKSIITTALFVLRRRQKQVRTRVCMLLAVTAIYTDVILS
jgi:ABC-type cobalamin/Fe3+-siderophores transport system ATPase subunit